MTARAGEDLGSRNQGSRELKISEEGYAFGKADAFGEANALGEAEVWVDEGFDAIGNPVEANNLEETADWGEQDESTERILSWIGSAEPGSNESQK